MKRLLIAALLLIPGVCLAAEIDAPERADVHTLVRVSTKTPGTGFAWFVHGAQGFVDAQSYDDGSSLVFTGAPGRYVVMLVVATDKGKLDQASATVVIGDVVPPGPGPGPTPPIPVPVTVGPRIVVIARETADTNPETSQLITSLRIGEPAKYLTEKKHSLSILDQNNPALLDEWRPHLAGLKLPVLVILDPATKKLLYKGELPSGTTAETILETIKKHGG